MKETSTCCEKCFAGTLSGTWRCINKNCPCHKPKQETNSADSISSNGEANQKEEWWCDRHKDITDCKYMTEQKRKEILVAREAHQHMTSNTGHSKEDVNSLWEEEFDGMFNLDDYGTSTAVQDKVKQFIQSHGQKEYMRGKHDGYAEEAIGCFEHCKEAKAQGRKEAYGEAIALSYGIRNAEDADAFRERLRMMERIVQVI